MLTLPIGLGGDRDLSSASVLQLADIDSQSAHSQNFALSSNIC